MQKKPPKKLKIAVISAVCLLAFVGVVLSGFSGNGYKKEVRAACGDKIDYRLVLAVIKAESGFDENALSPKGARGLMQLTPSTAKWLWEMDNDNAFNDEMLYQADINIKLGIKYLIYLLEKFELPFALAAYNAGEGIVSGWLKQGVDSVKAIPYDETRQYVKRVQSYYKIYKTLHKQVENY